MLNLVRLLDRAAYPDGRSATGAEAYAAYGRDSGPVFMRLGGKVVWQGRFELMLIGPADERWDMAMLIRQRSVADFVAFASNQAYLAGLGHRTAALEDSRLLPLETAAFPTSGARPTA